MEMFSMCSLLLKPTFGGSHRTIGSYKFYHGKAEQNTLALAQNFDLK